MEFPSSYIIETSRLILNPVEKEDLPAIVQIKKNNPGMSEYVSWGVPENIASLQQWYEEVFENTPDKNVFWAIRKDDRLIGRIAVYDISHTYGVHEQSSAEIGYWLDPDYGNRGFMTEALQAVIKFCFEKIRIHRLTIAHFPENIASQRVIEKCSFRRIGVQRDFAQLRSTGKWHNHVVYDLLSTDK